MTLQVHEIRNSFRVVAYEEGLIRAFRKSRLRDLKWSPVFFVFMFGLFAAVKLGGLWGVPTEASNYLLETVFWNFEEIELRRILSLNNGGLTYYQPLLLVYWLYFTLPMLMFGSGFWAASNMRKATRPIHRQGLISTNVLLEKISTAITEPSIKSKISLSLSLSHTDKIFRAVSPLKSHWYKAPTQQWLRLNDISPQSRSIAIALSKLRDESPDIVRIPELLPRFKAVIQEMHDYFLFIALIKDPKLQGAFDKHEVPDPIEKLAVFSREMRALCLDCSRFANSKAEPGRVLLWIQETLSSSVVRNAGLLSLLAGAVMFVGFFVFKIDAKSAFLTWFTVTFGSLTVSIGISSVSMVRGGSSHGDSEG